MKQHFLLISALVFAAFSFNACEEVNPDPVPGPDGPSQVVPTPTPDPDPDPDPVPPIEAVTATLTFEEAKDAFGGYSKPCEYTNTYGTWIICAYKNGSNMQLNGNKVAYIGTPEFDAAISSVSIGFDEAFKGDIYICSEPGNNQASGVVCEASVSSEKAVTISVEEKNLKKLFIRSGSCARISSITVVAGGSASTDPTPDPDPDPDPTPDPDPDPDPIPDPTPGISIASWYELPMVNDSDRNGIDDNDNTLYYATHSFDLNGVKRRNYTVCYSGDHHCPVWVAAPRHKIYRGSTDRTNAYKQDPSIPSGIQYKSKSTGGGCNKGHMLGSAERTCSVEANRQVFYYTNIAPQLSSGFNTGGGGWNILEDWVDNQVCSDTLYVVIGCYFDKFTDGYGNTVSPKTISFGGRNDVDFPTMFYYILLRTKKGSTGKALKNCSASDLKCAAFVRSHTNSLKGQKPSSREMMSVSDLEKLTGFTYFANVPQAPKDKFSASDWGL